MHNQLFHRRCKQHHIDYIELAFTSTRSPYAKWISRLAGLAGMLLSMGQGTGIQTLFKPLCPLKRMNSSHSWKLKVIFMLSFMCFKRMLCSLPGYNVTRLWIHLHAFELPAALLDRLRFVRIQLKFFVIGGPEERILGGGLYCFKLKRSLNKWK